MSGEPQNLLGDRPLPPKRTRKESDRGPHMEGVLFCLGNPLLDISAECDEPFLEKYDLKSNDAILAEDKHKPMYDDMVDKFKVEYVPGGSTQNTCRIAQWLIGVPRAITFMGCIGRDKYGKILEEKAKEAGVNVRYQYHDKEPTGTCAVLVTEKNRSLVAYLAAANCFTKDHLDKAENIQLMEAAKFYYISGFPLTVCPPAMMEIARHAAANDKAFIMNLSAPFLCHVFKEPMKEIMPFVDILFCNEDEAAAFSEANNFGTTDLKEIALRIARLPKQNGKKGRVIIITQGANPSLVLQEGKFSEFPVIHIDSKDIVDTNGAGDAFVGGFLAHLVNGDTIDQCMTGGNYAANLILQHMGCTFPDNAKYCVGTF